MEVLWEDRHQHHTSFHDFLQVLQNLKQKCVDLKENAKKTLGITVCGRNQPLEKWKRMSPEI